MRTLDCLRNKQIAIIGLGVTGLSCIRYLRNKQSQLNMQLCAMDSRASVPQLEAALSDTSSALPVTQPVTLPVTLGRFDTQMLAESQVWVVSPGIALTTPELVQAKQANTLIIGDIELFALFINAYQRNVQVAAVTGSNGKSTVVTLMRDMAQRAGVNVALAGNIGTPVLDVLSQLEQQNAEQALVILELSSFQLETTESLVPAVACILNISEDHMDRYPDFAGYCQAKQRIYLQAQCAVYLQEDANTHPSQSSAKALDKLLSFSAQPQQRGFGQVANDEVQGNQASITYDGNEYLRASELSVLGEHNLLNVQAAALMMRELGIGDEAILTAAREFSGLVHRCQHVAKKSGVTWINDSKATNVGATLAAISGIRSAIAGKLILLAGGDSKGADLSALEPVLNNDVNQVIVFGKDASLIKAYCADALDVADLQDAVTLAAVLAKQDDVVLLSPACASLDMFSDYQQRGEQFIYAVEALPS